ncbi:MAG: hypothetical protein HY897_18590 [Deltaproteobacteria bacterium]|nr:hypothetical protein [Deltaproteobacteria bacterium]
MVLFIGLVFFAYLTYAGAGFAWLLLPGEMKGRTALFAPVVGAALAVLVSHWFAFLGVSSGFAVGFTMILSTAANVLALARFRREGGAGGLRGLTTADSRRRAAAVAAIGVAVFVAAASPLMFGGRTDGPAVIGHNGDAITHLLLSESFGKEGFSSSIFDSHPHWTEFAGYPFRPLKAYLVGSLSLVDQASVITGFSHFQTYSVVGAVCLALAVVSVLLLFSPASSPRWWVAGPAFLACNALLYSLVAEDYIPQICAIMFVPAALSACMHSARAPSLQSVVLSATVAHALFVTNPFGIVLLGLAMGVWIVLAAARDGAGALARPLPALAAVAALAFAFNPLAAVRAAGGVGTRASIALEAEKGAFGKEYTLTADAAFGFFGFDRCPPSPYMEVRTGLFGRGCGEKAPLWKAYRGAAWPALGLCIAVLALGARAAWRRREDAALACVLAAAAMLSASLFVDSYTFFKALTHALVPAAVLLALGIGEAGSVLGGWRNAPAVCMGVLLVFQCVAGGNFLGRYVRGGVLADRGLLERAEYVRRAAPETGATIVFSVPLNTRWWYQYFLRDHRTAWMRDAAACAQPRMRTLHKKECSEETYARARKEADYFFFETEKGYRLEKAR